MLFSFKFGVHLLLGRSACSLWHDGNGEYLHLLTLTVRSAAICPQLSYNVTDVTCEIVACDDSVIKTFFNRADNECFKDVRDIAVMCTTPKPQWDRCCVQKKLN